MRLIYATFILLLALITSAQCQQSAQDWLNKGIALRTQGNYDEAIKAYDNAIEIDPQYTQAWNNKGNALIRKGKFNEAIKAYDEAIRLDPNLAEAWNNKGIALYYQGKYDESIKAYGEALRLNPNYFKAWYDKGITLDDQGKYNEATKAYDEALRLNPNDFEAWYNKGNALIDQGKYDEAINAYDEALKLNPNYVGAWNNKGNALDDQGKSREAINAYDNATKIDPQYAPPWNNKGLLLNRLGRYNESVKIFDTAIEINPKLVQAWRGKSEALQNLNLTGEAAIASAKANDLELAYGEKLIIYTIVLCIYLLLAVLGYKYIYIISKLSHISAGLIPFLTNLLGLLAFNWTFAGLFDFMLLKKLLFITSFLIVITLILLGFLGFPLASFWRRLAISFHCLLWVFEEFEQNHTKFASGIKKICLISIIIYPVVSTIFYFRTDFYSEQIMLYYLGINLLIIPTISLMVTLPPIFAGMLSIDSDRDTLNTLLAFQFSNLGINFILIFVALWIFGLFRNSFSISFPFLMIVISLFIFFLLPYLIGWQSEKKMRELFLRKEHTWIGELLDILEFSTPSLCISKLQQLYVEIERDKTKIDADTTCGVILVKRINEITSQSKELNYGRSLLNEAVIQQRNPLSNYLDFLKKLQDNLHMIISEFNDLEKDTDKLTERAYKYASSYHARNEEIAKSMDDVKSAKPLLWLALVSLLSLMVSFFVNSFSQTLIQGLPQLVQASGGLVHAMGV